MRFGVHNNRWVFGEQDIFESIKRKAQRAEALGFRWFSVMDHLIEPYLVGAEDEPFMESWTTISALAAVTSKIRLATMVSSVAFRNPALLAKMAATVDVISHGRLTLGIGGGWYEKEYRQYGYVFPERPSVRLAQMQEAIKLITTLWSETRTTFHGNYFHVDDAVLQPKPVQKPHPPILIGGSGEKITLRAVARQANMCNIFGTPAEVQAKYDVLRRHCDAEGGRNFDDIERSNTSAMLLARDESALKAKRERLGLVHPLRGNAMTVPQAIELAGQFRDAGSQLLIASFWKNDEDSIELLASDVMPHFHG